MIKGISYWSFTGGLEGTRPVAEVFAEAKKAGYESVEVCLSGEGEVSMSTTQKSSKEVIKAANDNGIKISSVATGLFWGKSLSASDAGVRKDALEYAKQLIDVAAWLDAGAVLLIPGAVNVPFDPSAEVVDYNTVYKRASEAVASLVPQAASNKIAICIENVWNMFLVGPVELNTFIDQFKSEWVGSYFDVGNCMNVGFPEHWIKVLGKRIKRVHFKDFRRNVGSLDGFCDILSGDVNWPEVIKSFKEIGYDGFVTAEMIPLYKHYPEVLITNTSRAMDAILGR